MGKHVWPKHIQIRQSSSVTCFRRSRKGCKGYAETLIWGPESPRHGTHQAINLHQKVSTEHMCFSVESGPRRTETHAGAIRHSPSTVKTDMKSSPKTKMTKNTIDFCHRDRILIKCRSKVRLKYREKLIRRGKTTNFTRRF